MIGGVGKFSDSVDKGLEKISQELETTGKTLSLEILRSRLDEVLPIPSAERGRVDESQEWDSVKQHPKEVTLDDGTVVNLPDTPGSVSYTGETSGGREQSEASQDMGRDKQNVSSRNELSDGGSGVRVSEGNDVGENKNGLTDEQEAEIRENTGWPDEIIDAIGSMEEYEIYKNAGPVVREINGKLCLAREDIDWEQKDAMGRSNRERAEQGLSPIDKVGNVIELHHIGQHPDSPLAELTPEEHRGKGNDTILHDKTKESEIDRNAFGEERRSHWKDRAEEDDKNE